MLSTIHSSQWRFALCLILLAALLPACSLMTSNTNTQGGQTTISGPPVVRVAAPQPNAPYLEGVPVNIEMSISNAGADIDRIEIAVDGVVISALSAPNAAGAVIFSAVYSWPAKGQGQHTINVTAFRHDGSSSAPASVSINVVSQASNGSTGGTTGSQGGTTGGQTTGGSQPANNNTDSGAQPTQAQPPSPTLPPTQAPPTDTPPPSNTPTPSVPTGLVSQGANVRSGPSTLFNPPMGSVGANTTVTLLAVNSAHDWYKVQYYGAAGWIAAILLTVSGDIASLPVDNGPPIPTLTPVIPTAVPATAVPTSHADLIVTQIRTKLGPPVCNQMFVVLVDFQNRGTEATAGGGTILIQDFESGTNTMDQQVTSPFPALQPKEGRETGDIPITVSSYYGVAHKIIARINADMAIPESNYDNNLLEFDYTLARGSC
jgi:uncharacterized protein YraI